MSNRKDFANQSEALDFHHEQSAHNHSFVASDLNDLTTGDPIVHTVADDVPPDRSDRSLSQPTSRPSQLDGSAMTVPSYSGLGNDDILSLGLWSIPAPRDVGNGDSEHRSDGETTATSSAAFNPLSVDDSMPLPEV
jgi:hypothetical protein